MDSSIADNSYIIDLGYAKTASDIIFEFSSILETDMVKNKKIFLKLNDVELNQTQLQSIKSLISSINSNLTIIETPNVQTQQAALALGIIVENPEMKEKFAQAESVTEQISHINNDFDAEEVQNQKEAETNEQAYEANSEVNYGCAIDTGYHADFEKNDFAVAKSEEIHELDIIFDEEKNLGELLNKEPEMPNVEYVVSSSDDYTSQDYELDNLPTMYLKQTLRSGQAVNYDGNIVIIGDAHCGSEINATGDITVWGILSGIAHAGINGNERAKIRALKMNALQLRIADWYSRRPDGARILSVDRSSTFEPEEARVIDGVVVLFKVNE